MWELEKSASLLEPHRTPCQVTMLFPFNFCWSCNNAGTFETQKPGPRCDFPKGFLKIPRQQLIHKECTCMSGSLPGTLLNGHTLFQVSSLYYTLCFLHYDFPMSLEVVF